jgi:hypothetical protein
MRLSATRLSATGHNSGISLDAATHDYLGQIRGAGIVVTSTQQNAIDDFIVAEKIAGRWASHKRIYLPIWANAAANAICMKTCLSGTFVNAPTHGSGFVQGNGSTSYFNTNATVGDFGWTDASCLLGALISENSTADATIGGFADASHRAILSRFSGNLGGNHPVSGIFLNSGTPTGICALSATSTAMRRLHRRATSGFTTPAESATTSTATLTNTRAISFMARNTAGVISGHSNAKFGAFFGGLGMSTADVSAFTANLKTLWETCTGLTLP